MATAKRKAIREARTAAKVVKIEARADKKVLKNDAKAARTESRQARNQNTLSKADTRVILAEQGIQQESGLSAALKPVGGIVSSLAASLIPKIPLGDMSQETISNGGGAAPTDVIEAQQKELVKNTVPQNIYSEPLSSGGGGGVPPSNQDEIYNGPQTDLPEAVVKTKSKKGKAKKDNTMMYVLIAGALFLFMSKK